MRTCGRYSMLAVFTCSILLVGGLATDWVLSSMRPRSYRWYLGTTTCVYLSSDAGRFVVGCIRDFPHGRGSDNETLFWLDGMCRIPPRVTQNPLPFLSFHFGGHLGLLRMDPGFLSQTAVILPHWAVLVPASLAATLVGFYSIRSVRKERLRRTGHCQKCGYDLTGNTSGICPECGVRPENQ